MTIVGGTKSKRILLIDDHTDVREVMSRWLVRAGYEVTSAATFKEALCHCGVNHFDLLLGDLTDQDQFSYDLLREMARHCHIKGIAYTGHGHEIDAARAREAGFTAHILKPVDYQILVDTVAKVLSSDLERRVA